MKMQYNHFDDPFMGLGEPIAGVKEVKRGLQKSRGL